MIILTEKDKKILDAIAEYGGIYVGDTKGVYNKNQYYRRRLKKLMDEGYLIRKNSILYFASVGKQYIENQGKHYRNIGSDVKLRKRAAEMYSLFNGLHDFTIIPSFKIERMVKSFAYRYYGKVINKSGKEYWIYRIGKSKLKEDDKEYNERKAKGIELEILKLKNEIEEIKNALKNINLMIFIEDKMSMDIYKKVLGSIAVEEHIILPYVPSGVAIANNYIGKGEGENNKVLQKLQAKGLKAKLGHSSWSTPDFDIEGTFGFNFTTNDFKKESKLIDYLNLINKPQNISIVCNKAQEKKYKNEYENSRVIVID